MLRQNVQTICRDPWRAMPSSARRKALRGGLPVAALACMAAMSPGGAAPARPGLHALRGIEQGQWELRERGSQVRPRRICIGDTNQLVQPLHPAADCRRFVVTDANNRATVTYRCAAQGTGRTDLFVETPRLVQIESQGVSASAPFSLSLEARRVGDCN